MSIRVGWLPTGTQSAEDTRQATGFLIMPDSLSAPRSGVMPSIGIPFALTSTGSLSCTVGPGTSIVCPAKSTYQGGYPVTVDASGAGLPPLTFAAGGSLARTDVVYIQVQDNAEDAGGATQGVVAVQQGTNGGGVPAVPSGANALWQVPVPAGAASINFATATPAYRLTTTAGGVVPAGTPGVPSNAYVGMTRARYDRAMTATPGPLEVYDGAAWQPAVPVATTPAGTPRGIMAVPLSTAANGTPTASTTDTLDTIMGTYTFTAVAGRRYRVVLENLICNGSVSADVFAIRVRNGGAGTPTTASPAVLDSGWTCVVIGSAGRVTLTLEDTFLASSSGMATLACFYQRASGTGILTPLSPSVGGTSGLTGLRKLYVEDIGNI